MAARGADRCRADRALVVDRQRIEIPVRRFQFRAGGGNCPAVVDRRLGRGRGRRGRRADKNMLFAGEVEQHIVSRGEADDAVGRIDRALVIDRLADQANAVAERSDRALVHHARRTAPREMKVVIEKIAIGDVARAGKKTVGVHHAAGPHDDAVAVDQVNLSVGRKRAVDHRHLPAQHPVQRRAAGGGLHELRQFTRADGKTLPVDNGNIARLIDRDRAWNRRDRG